MPGRDSGGEPTRDAGPSDPEDAASSSIDWAWPKRVDREAVEELFKLEFMAEAANVVLIGPNGVGKTMIAQNLAHEALLQGHGVRFTTASLMLAELGACEGTASLERALARYVRPGLLVVDEVGYLSYSDRAADLLFEVVTLVDRLVHRAEVIAIAGDSFRAKESAERSAAKSKARKKSKRPPDAQPGDQEE